MNTLLVIILILLLIGGLPQFGYHGAGWYPSGGLGVIVVILLILMLMKVI